MPSRPPAIAIAFDLKFREAAEIFAGISGYVTERRMDWRLVPLSFGFEPRLMELAASGDLAGAIGTFVSDSWIDGLSATGVRAVNVFQLSRITRHPSIGFDDFQIGKSAAEHLVAQGARSFAFFGTDSAHFNQLRREGFERGIRGHAYTSIRPGPPLRDQIVAMGAKSFPVGVACTSDQLAREFINAARALDLRCPNDFLVTGVHNDPAESIFASKGITSFKLPTELVAREAARRLDGLLSGESSEPGAVLIGDPELVVRESTLASPGARAGQRAVDLIEQRLEDPELDVGTLARELGLSRRSLETSVKETTGESPFRYIGDLRFDRARRLLRESRHPIMEVGRRCGYPEAHHFSAWFKNRAGVSPKAYRESRHR